MLKRGNVFTNCRFHISCLQNLCGKFTIDLFADSQNKKVERFYSKYWEEGCAGVDAFAYSWADEFCWVVPPVNLVARAINKILFDRAKGVLIVPRWKSSLFWPLLLDNKSKYKYFVRNEYIYTDCSKVLTAGINCKFFSSHYAGHMMALQFDASR